METAILTEPFYNYPFKILAPQAINPNPSLPQTIRNIGAKFPAMVTVQEFGTKANVYINEYGCNFLEHHRSELLKMGIKYYSRFFPRNEMKIIQLRLQKLVKEKRPDKTTSFFQRIRPNTTSEYSWFFTTSQLYPSHQNPETYLLHISLPVNKCSYMDNQLDSLVEENIFIRKNHGRFQLLSEREKEIINLISQGITSQKIADSLCISIHTVNNHRKNIIHKIGKKNLSTFIKLFHMFE